MGLLSQKHSSEKKKNGRAKLAPGLDGKRGRGGYTGGEKEHGGGGGGVGR